MSDLVSKKLSASLTDSVRYGENERVENERAAELEAKICLGE